MEERIAIWREALNDEHHPRHRLAWTLFPQNMKVEAAARRLEGQQDAVIPLLLEILDIPELYEAESLGAGFAPIHAVELLGHWQVVEALPRLLKIIEQEGADENWDSIVLDRAIFALEKMGPPILEPMLHYAQTADKELYMTIAGVLSEIGQEDARAYAWVKAVFDTAEAAKDETAVRLYAEMLLEIDSAAAITLLEERLRGRKYSKELRRVLEGYLQDTREKGSL